MAANGAVYASTNGSGLYRMGTEGGGGDGPMPVPEPATYWLIAIGLAWTDVQKRKPTAHDPAIFV